MAGRRTPSWLWVAVLALVAGMAGPASAQGFGEYWRDNFDTDDGSWTRDAAVGGVGWFIDATPASPGYYSSPYSLNYNDGTDFDNGGTNSGSATSPAIDLSGLSTPIRLKFRCWYQTEGGGTYDQKWVRIITASDGSTISQGQVYQGASGEYNCASAASWHEHTFTNLQPSWGQVRIRFYFNTVDSVANNYQGWFIDDVVIEAWNPNPPTVPTGVVQARSPTAPGEPAGMIVGPTVYFRALVSDPDNNPCRLQVEIAPETGAFGDASNVVVTSPAVPSGNEATVSYTFGGAALPDGRYQWRARALDNANAASSWVVFDASTNFHFHGDSVPPGTPKIVTPPSNADVTVHPPAGPAFFQWEPVTDVGPPVPVRYNIQITQDGTFADLLLQVTQTEVTFETDLAPSDELFYWRVRAVDAAGNPSAWTPTIAFRVVVNDGLDHGGGDCPGSAPGGGAGLAGLLAALGTALAARRFSAA